MADYDTLKIKIVANTTIATNQIKALSTRLDELDKQAQNLDLKQLGKVQKLLQDIANIDFSKVSSGLYAVVKAFESLQSSASKVGSNGGIMTALEQLDNTSTASVEAVAETIAETGRNAEITAEQCNKMFDSIEQFNDLMSINWNNGFLGGIDYSWLDSLKEKVKVVADNFVAFDRNVNTLKADINDSNAQFEQLGEEMSKIGLNGTQMEQVLKTIGLEINTFSPEQIKQLETAMTELGYSSEQVKMTISKLKTNIEKTTNKATSGLQKVALKMKSLALYRVMRLALMKIQEAFISAIQELAKYDSKFNSSISEIKSSFSYLSRSLVAMVAPIINLLAPIISAITNELGQLANSIGKVFSGDKYIEATQSVEDYAKSLEKAKNVSLGIDELNVVSQDEDKSLFSTTDGEQATFLSDTFSTIGELVATINSSLSSFASDILPAIKTILQPIMQIIGFIVDLINQLVGDTFESVNDSLVSFTEMVGSILGFVAELVDALLPVIRPILNVISVIINLINEVLSLVFDTVGGIFNDLKLMKPLLSVLLIPLGFIMNMVSTIFYIVKGVVETIIALLRWDFASIGGIWERTTQDIQQGWEEWAAAIDEDTSGSTESYTNASNYDSYSPGSSSSNNSGSSSSGTTQVNVYIDGQDVAKRVNTINDNRGANTLRGGTLSYVK